MNSLLKAFTVMVVTVVLMLAAGLPASAAGEGSGGGWQYSLTPYLWLPSVDGDLRFSVPPGAGGSPDVKVGPNDYLENLNAVLMVKGEARKDNLAIFTDFIYLSFDDEKGSVRTVNGPGGVVQIPVNVSGSTSLKGFAWQLAGSYTVARSQSSTLDVLGGVRYFGVEATVDWNLAGPLGLFPQSGSFSQSDDLWDGIVGVRGKVGLGKDWFMPYYADIGMGSSDLTWQGLAGIGYAFKWGDLLLAYRHLYYDQGDDKLFQKFRFSGPAFGVNFRF